MNNPSASTASVSIKDQGNLDGSLKLETIKGSYITSFHAGIGGNVEIRSALMSSLLTLQDMGGKTCIGTGTPYSTFSNTIANSTALLNALQVNGDVSMLTKLSVNTPTPANTATVAIKGGSGEQGSLLIESVKGAYVSVFNSGSGGNVELRSANTSGFISLNDHGARVFIGCNAAYTLFSNTIGNSTAFLNFAQFNGDVTMLTRLIVNSPITTNASIAFNGASGTDGTLFLSTSKASCPYVCRIHSSTLANIELRSGSATGTMFLQDHGGLLVAGALNAVTGFQNTFGGKSIFASDHTIQGNAIIDKDLLVRGFIVSSSDSRLKDNVEIVSEDLCINIIKSVQPNTYIRNDIINSTREIGFIAQDIKAQMSSDTGNLVKEIPDNTYETIYAVDYSRLTTLLWGVCRNLISRVETLESQLTKMAI